MHPWGEGRTHRRVARAAVVAGVVAVLAAASVACAPVTRVLVIGDSLTVGAAQAGLGRQAGATWTIDAVVGRGTNAGTEVARRYDLSRYDVVIVALGTNDYLDSKALYAARIDRMMAVLGPTRPVVWVDVDANVGRLAAAGPTVNAAIAAAPSRHRNLRAASWHGYLRADAGAAALRAADLVHCTPRGYAVRAAWTGHQLPLALAGPGRPRPAGAGRPAVSSDR